MTIVRGSDHTEMRGDTESALMVDNIPPLADKPFRRDANPDPQPIRFAVTSLAWDGR